MMLTRLLRLGKRLQPTVQRFVIPMVTRQAKKMGWVMPSLGVMGLDKTGGSGGVAASGIPKTPNQDRMAKERTWSNWTRLGLACLGGGILAYYGYYNLMDPRLHASYTPGGGGGFPLPASGSPGSVFPGPPEVDPTLAKLAEEDEKHQPAKRLGHTPLYPTDRCLERSPRWVTSWGVPLAIHLLLGNGVFWLVYTVMRFARVGRQLVQSPVAGGGWVVPVALGALTVSSLLAAFLVHRHVVYRRRQAAYPDSLNSLQ